MDSAIPLQTTMHESMLPFYQSNVCDPNRADSGLTYNNPLQRKRSRDFSTELVSLQPHQKNRVMSSESSSFLDQVLYQFQNQQSDIDRILAQHVSFFILHLINFFYFFFKFIFFEKYLILKKKIVFEKKKKNSCSNFNVSFKYLTEKGCEKFSNFE
jgi:hypothetical protein